MTYEGRRQEAGLDPWLFPFAAFAWGFPPTPSSLLLSMSDSLLLRAFLFPSRSAGLFAMVGGADIDRGAGMFLLDGPR